MKVYDILAMLKAKDEKGLALLYEQYAAALLGIIIRIVQSEKLGEEILQQTFLKIWDKIETYDANKGTLFTWMSQIARNTAIDQRRLKQFEFNLHKEQFEESIHLRKKIYLNTSSIDVEVLLTKLEQKHKEVIDLIYLHGYTQQQTSDELNIPLGTVKTRLRNATLALRRILQNESDLFRNSLMSIFIILFCII